MKIFFYLFLFLFSGTLFGNDCLNNKSETGEFWTRELGRGQLGKYYQFTSKSISEIAEEGWFLAKGNALSLLKEECGDIPNGVKAFEQCQHRVDDVYYSYIRYSVDKRKCHNKNLERNDELNQVLKRFQLHQEKIELKSELQCIGKRQSCLKSALVLFELSKEKKAVKLLEHSCNNGISRDCFFLANYFSQLDRQSDYVQFTRKACLRDHKEACISFYGLFKNKKVDVTGLEKSLCKAGFSTFCPKTNTPEEVEVLEDSVQSFEI